MAAAMTAAAKGAVVAATCTVVNRAIARVQPRAPAVLVATVPIRSYGTAPHGPSPAPPLHSPSPDGALARAPGHAQTPLRSPLPRCCHFPRASPPSRSGNGG